MFGHVFVGAEPHGRDHADQVGLRRLSEFLSGVTERLGREINPHVLAPDEFKERKLRGDHFLTSVLAAPKLFVKGTEDELATMGE
ncbi:MAG: hypothetical protein ACYDH9_03225 [Limisphaerales bacterium]